MSSGKALDSVHLKIVNVGDSVDSFYRAIYGAAKYKTKIDNFDLIKPVDFALLIYKKINTAFTGTEIDEATFVRALRDYIGNEMEKDSNKDRFFKKNMRKDTVSLFDRLKNYVDEHNLKEYDYWLVNAPEEFKTTFSFSEFSDKYKDGTDSVFYKGLGYYIKKPLNRYNNYFNYIVRFILLDLTKKQVRLFAYTLHENTPEILPPEKSDVSSDDEIYIFYYKDKYSYYSALDNAGLKEGLQNKTIYTYKNNTSIVKNNTSLYDKSGQIFDTVDYYSLGANRYKQFLDKYNFEQEIYKDQRLLTTIANKTPEIEEKVAVLNNAIRTEIENEYFLRFIQCKQIITANEDSIADILSLLNSTRDMTISLMQQAANDEMAQRESHFKELIFEIKKNAEYQMHLMENYSLEAAVSRDLGVESTLMKASESVNKNKMHLHEIRDRGYGSYGHVAKVLIRMTNSLDDELKRAHKSSEILFDTLDYLKDKLYKFQTSVVDNLNDVASHVNSVHTTAEREIKDLYDKIKLMKIDVPAHTVNVGGYGANQLTASGYLGGGRHGGPITLDVTGTINIPEFTSKTLGDSNTGVTWDLNNPYMTYFDVPAFKGPDAPDKVKRPGPPPVATPTAVVPLPPEIDC